MTRFAIVPAKAFKVPANRGIMETAGVEPAQDSPQNQGDHVTTAEPDRPDVEPAPEPDTEPADPHTGPLDDPADADNLDPADPRRIEHEPPDQTATDGPDEEG